MSVTIDVTRPPPPNMPGAPGAAGGGRFFHMPRFSSPPQFNTRYSNPFGTRQRFQGGYRPFHQRDQHHQHNKGENADDDFDGKRMRKSVYRKTIDYNSSAIKYLQGRVWQRDMRDLRSVQPDIMSTTNLQPPGSMLQNNTNCVTTKFIRQSTNKFKCPIFAVCWTPEGRRLITGASSGEFTLWNGLTFNFETILQAHDTSCRSMVWSHSDQWMITADHGGFVKYWQSNMNNVKMYQAHQDPVRGLSFCPTDQKFVTCSDDGTVRVWDFLRCHEERVLRGHGADVRCVDWHPHKGLVASGSRDTQQPVKLWDPKSGTSLTTLHSHKGTVMALKWNRNGNWLLTASRDHLVKLYDVRNLKEDLQTFKGHNKEATAVAWHPVHESLFASGGSDGSIMFWNVGTDKELGAMTEAHEAIVWCMSWHPLGHILVSGSNDHNTKFWSRNPPGDKMLDKYNLNKLPPGVSEDMMDLDGRTSTTGASDLPGMGLEFGVPDHLKKDEPEENGPGIPGLGGTNVHEYDSSQRRNPSVRPYYQNMRKVPYAKPVPKSFEQAWEKGFDKAGDGLPGDQDPGVSQQGSPQKQMGDQHGGQGGPHGPPHSNQGPTHGNQGPPHSNQGPPHGNQGAPHSNQGPPHGNQGPPHGNQEPPHANQGPPHDHHGSQFGNQGIHMHYGNQEGPPQGMGMRPDGPRPSGPPSLLNMDLNGPRGPRMGGPRHRMDGPRGPRGPRMDGPRGHMGPRGPRMDGKRFNGPRHGFDGPRGQMMNRGPRPHMQQNAPPSLLDLPDQQGRPRDFQMDPSHRSSFSGDGPPNNTHMSQGRPGGPQGNMPPPDNMENSMNSDIYHTDYSSLHAYGLGGGKDDNETIENQNISNNPRNGPQGPLLQKPDEMARGSYNNESQHRNQYDGRR
ncbi:unnamed protein product [Owenia fusiformis]|uniref:pre-mRNA 3' end processing protein WDR33 n=1 Tax=Owenia fusiformis TaxID=6347 RepID=A0A8J1YA20_OWEFU|nr:unnamed protein product [Owenia fusiformis]